MIHVRGELIQQREMKLNHAFRDAQRQQSLETSRIQRLTIRNRDVRTADDNDYKGDTWFNSVDYFVGVRSRSSNECIGPRTVRSKRTLTACRCRILTSQDMLTRKNSFRHSAGQTEGSLCVKKRSAFSMYM